MRIQINGFSGSGKSTLAKKLSDYYNLPLLHMDTVRFFGDWQSKTIEEQTSLTREFLKENKEWVIDGNYSRVAPERFSMSDMTIYLKYNRFYCYYKCLMRYFAHRGKTRDSLGCLEKFDLEFQWWILFKGRTKRIRRQHQKNLEATPGEKYVFKNKRQLTKFLNNIFK
jgi:adenylate kinase family enzyme